MTKFAILHSASVPMVVYLGLHALAAVMSLSAPSTGDEKLPTRYPHTCAVVHISTRITCTDVWRVSTSPTQMSSFPHKMFLPPGVRQLDASLPQLSTPAVLKARMMVAVAPRNLLEEKDLTIGTPVAVWSRT